MSNLEIWILLIIMSYIGVILVSLPVRKDNGPEFWVKILFWPITVLVYVLGIILWLLIVIRKNIFKGMVFVLVK